MYSLLVFPFFFFFFFFFFQAEDGIRDGTVTGVQTCALPISPQRLAANWNAISRCCPIVLPLLRPIGLAGVGSLKPSPGPSVFTIVIVAEIGRASCRERV